MPDYGSVHDIVYTSLRSQAIVMNPTYRGQRNSDVPFQAEYPGLLTEGIETPETYVMRQVFADALRAVHALLTQQVATVSSLTITGAGLGGSLALAVASQCPTVMAVAAVGFMMLTGRMNWRFGATVIIGVFILFGAASIVSGIQAAAG